MEDNRFEKIVALVTFLFLGICATTWIFFLSFKLTGILPEAFPWFWVWFPMWLPFAVFGVLLFLGVICCLFATGLDDDNRL